MADVIEFIERMGKDAQLRHASAAVLEQAMRDAQMSPGARAALLRGDRAEIQAILGGESNVCCVIYAPEPDGDPKQPRAAHGVDNVCCLIWAPDGDEQQSDAGRKAA